MAIAEFGRSLLGDVRARKDQQADDARKYARKQAKKELNLAGAAFLGGQFFKAATSNLKTKTSAFLANSDLNKRKIDMQQAEKKALEATTHFNNAEKSNISMYDLSLQNSADAAVAAKKIKDPNSIKPNEEGDWRAMFMERDIHMQNALAESSYFEEVIKRGKEIKLGKSNYSLDSLASVQRPKTIVGSMWNKFTDQETSVDVFNHQMSKLKQVVAADAINALTFDRRVESAEKIVADGGDPSLVNALVGAPTNKEEEAKIKKSLKLGETRTEEAKALVSNSAGVFSRVVVKYTASNKQDTRVEVEDTKVVDGKDIITQSDVASAIGNIPQLYAMIADNYTIAGQKLFQKEADKIMVGKKLSVEVVEQLWAKGIQAATWDGYSPDMNTGKLDSEVMAQYVKAWTAASANLVDTIAANISNPTPEAQQKVIDAANGVQAIQTSMQTDLSNRNLSGSGILTAVQKAKPILPAGTQHTTSSGTIYYANGKGDWLTYDPTKK
mgnify:FL=1|tara:strand:+ start:1390 stop:2883 length:1494 start_codon:yes stop_codon:yes gene_type:complete